LFDSDVQEVSKFLISVDSLLSTKHDLFSFKLLYANLRGGMDGTFMAGRHLTSLHHCT